MTIKPALCRADQSSSFGHLRPSPQTSVTTTPNCPLPHNPPPAHKVHSAVQESCQTRALNDYDSLYSVRRRTQGHLTEHLTYGIILV